MKLCTVAARPSMDFNIGYLSKKDPSIVVHMDSRLVLPFLPFLFADVLIFRCVFGVDSLVSLSLSLVSLDSSSWLDISSDNSRSEKRNGSFTLFIQILYPLYTNVFFFLV